MASKTLTASEKQQKLDQQYQLVQATLDYMSSEFLNGLAILDNETALHFDRLRAEAGEHYRQRKLATLNKWFRDIAAPALVNDGHAFAAYIQKATGLTIDVKSDFEKRIARVCKHMRIRTDAEFYDVRDMIDSLDPSDPEHETQLQLLYDLTAEYEGFLDAKDVGKPRKKGKALKGKHTEILRLPSPDGLKVLTITESEYEDQPEWDNTQLILEYLIHQSGSGLYHANQVNAGISARWEGNARLIITTGQVPFNEEYSRQKQDGMMNDRVDVEIHGPS
jgi:hypothetical protein